MTNLKQFQVSECDIEIIRKLSKYYLTTKMIYALLPTFGEKASFKSFSVLKEHLRNLYQEGYINRDYHLSRGQGVNEYYYFLTKKGSRFLEDLEHIKTAHGILKRLEPSSQEHAFMISQFMIKLEHDIWQNKEISALKGFVRENYFEIKIPRKKKTEKDRYLKPDGTIFINIHGQDHLLFLEADLSTEPVMSANPYRSSFRKKVDVYSLFKRVFNDHPLVKYFGPFKGFRVVTVCRTPERMHSLADAARSMGKEKMFWFCSLEQVKENNILFSPFWLLPEGTTRSLFEKMQH